MNNLEIREALWKRNMKQWELAEKLGVSESVLCRKLRNELSEEERDKILKVIKEK